MEDPVLLVWKTVEAAMAKEHRKPLEAGKSKKKILPLISQKGTQPCPDLDFSPLRPRVDFGCPELSSWGFVTAAIGNSCTISLGFGRITEIKVGGT